MNKLSKSTAMNTKSAGRIQSSSARSNRGGVTKGSFAARAQSTATKGAKSSRK